jgi:hypothetical protein
MGKADLLEFLRAGERRFGADYSVSVLEFGVDYSVAVFESVGHGGETCVVSTEYLGG